MRSIPTYKTMSNRAVVRFICLLVVVVPLMGTLLAIALLWQQALHVSDLVLLVTLYSLTTFGVGVGFHRMLSHRSFRPHPVVKLFLLILGSMAFQGPPLEWAATHIKHHALTDRPGDPHSPVEGLFHAHMGWLFKDSLSDPRVYCRHLLNDKLVIYISWMTPLWFALSLAIPFLLGGWSGLLWGGLVRIFLVNHVFYSVNSIGHTFGRRPFETKDRSHNVSLLALLSFGEGWHNTHHAFPRAAILALHWWQVDLCGALIWVLERLRLADEVHRISPDVLARRSPRKADAN